jgi:hypothetical protein
MARDPTVKPVLQSYQRYFSGGVDQWSLPDQLEAGEYRNGMNVACRGGIVQTRPGTRTLYCLPQGRRQGERLFTPAGGISHQAVAIAGRVYVSRAPFKEWSLLENIQFSSSSRHVCFTECLKSTDYDETGVLYFLDQPYKVLMMQDGRTRAAFWDGSTNGHSNPTPTNNDELTQPDSDGTQIGLWSVWSNNRYWVSSGNRVFASDIGNPLKFKDRRYLNEAPSFFLADECTGMIETTDQAGILCFTAENCDFIESSIHDRAEWLQTANMQRTVFKVGCVAPKSLVAQHGFIYWFSPAGLMSLNDALRENTTSELIPLDQEMAWSKAYIGPDLEDIVCGTFENYLLVSVPHCSLYNTHTWAMDLAVFEKGGRAWNGVWTGWRPSGWMTGVVSGRSRCFFVSYDYDGENRVWEAFMPDRRDNGCEITCLAQFKADALGSAERKKFTFAKIELAEVFGDVSVMAAVSSSRGWFDRIMTREVVATDRWIDTDEDYGEGSTYPTMGGNRPQVRQLETEIWRTPSDCNGCGVESRDLNNVDTHFSLAVAWTGRAGVVGYRLFGTDDSDQSADCKADETGPRHLLDSGCGSTDDPPADTDPFPTFTGNATLERTDLGLIADSISVQACATSQISQVAADRKAECFANQQVNWLVDQGPLVSFTHTFGCLSITVAASSGELAVYRDDGVTLVTSLDFTLPHDSEGELITLILRNIGGGVLTLGAISFAGTGYELVVGPAEDTLDPGEETTIVIRAVVV